jgi:hypothetical protein
MAYFNHAFRKTWVVTSAGEAADGTATSALQPGEFGLVREDNWQVDSAADIKAAKTLAYLVGGNLRASDNIGNNPGHGGYQESIKSKGINFNYVTRMGEAQPLAAAQATSEICLASDCAPCGENLFIRLDVKGSPALRFLNHNAYAIGDSSGDAAANGGPLPALLCCDGTKTNGDPQDHVDPVLAGAAAIQMLLADPIIKPFVREGVSSAAGIPATFGAGATTGTLFAGTYPGVATTNSGSGTGLTVDIVVGASAVTSIVVSSGTAGIGYAVGDTITVAGDLVGGTVTTDDITFDVATLLASGAGVEVNTNGTKTYFSIADILDATSSTYSPSVEPVVENISVCFSLQGAYAETKFGSCSFDTRDFYGKEPVSIITSLLDETGNPCNDCGVSTNTAGQMAQTQGETVIRELLLTERYLQNPYNQGQADSARIREIEGFDEIVGAIDRSALYKAYYLQHSVPRFNNPSGVFDNDQYLYTVYVKSTDAAVITQMDTLWDEIAAQCQAVDNYTVVNDDNL